MTGIDSDFSQDSDDEIDVVEVDAVLRALGTRQGRQHGGEVEFQRLAVVDLAGLGNAIKFLRLEVGTERVDFLVGAAGADDLYRYAREHLAGHKRPKDYYFVDELPHTATGKLQRNAVPAQLGLA